MLPKQASTTIITSNNHEIGLTESLDPTNVNTPIKTTKTIKTPIKKSVVNEIAKKFENINNTSSNFSSVSHIQQPVGVIKSLLTRKAAFNTNTNNNEKNPNFNPEKGTVNT